MGTIDELRIAAAPAAWEALGFTVADGRCVIGTIAICLLGEDAGRGMLGWSLRDVPAVDLDGLVTDSSQAPPREPAGAHPNGVLAVDHVVAMTPALDRSVAALQAAGLDLRRVREEPTPAGAPRQAFFRLGEAILEVVQEPADAVERGGGSDRPARLWGLALVVEDIDRAVASMAPHIGTVRDAVQAGRQIVTVRRSAGVGVPLALMSTRETAKAA